MKKTIVLIGALIATISAAKAQLITGSMGVGIDPFVVPTANYTSTSLKLTADNLVTTAEQGDLASLVPAHSDLTAYTGTITGLSTTAKTVNIADFFVFSYPDGTLGTSGTSPDGRFEFNLTTLAETGAGIFQGTGTLVDTQGVYADTAATFTIGFSGSDSYSFTIAGAPLTAPVPEPTTIAAGALMLLPMGMSALRALRKEQKA